MATTAFIRIGDDFPFEVKDVRRDDTPLLEATLHYVLANEDDEVISEGDMSIFEDGENASFEATIPRADLDVDAIVEKEILYLDVVITDDEVQTTKSAQLQAVKRLPVFQN